MSIKQYEKKGTPPKTTCKKKATSHQRTFHGKSRRFRTAIKAAVFIGVAILVLGVIYFIDAGNGPSASTNATSKYPFEVGSPGPGEQAPQKKENDWRLSLTLRTGDKAG